MLYLNAANVAWAILYEIVYSFQDVRDDATAGVGTVTLLISRRPKPLLAVLAVLQTVLFTMLGVQMRGGVLYYALTIVLGSASVAAKLRGVDLADPESCLCWFSQGALITGGAIAAGLLAEYVRSVGGGSVLYEGFLQRLREGLAAVCGPAGATGYPSGIVAALLFMAHTWRGEYD